MKIIVCIKQIPDTNDVKWTKDNNILREGTISILNPYDLYSLCMAKQIENSEITLLSMGPNNAKEAILQGLAFGAKEGILLSDKKFSGADTLATAKTLKYAIQNVIKDYDLIITGQFALDGDTAQTPYSLANLLKIPHIGYVNKIDNIEQNSITVTSTKDDGVYKIKSEFPLMISVSGFEGEIYKPKINDYISSQNKEIKVLSFEDIMANPDEIGIKGSPTYVSKAFRPQNKRNCKFLNNVCELTGELK